MLSKRKKILTIISICVLFILAGSLGIYFWLNAQVNNLVDRESYRQWVEQINAGESLPERFVEIYGMVTGFNENSTTKRAIFNFNYIHQAPPVHYIYPY